MILSCLCERCVSVPNIYLLFSNLRCNHLTADERRWLYRVATNIDILCVMKVSYSFSIEQSCKRKDYKNIIPRPNNYVFSNSKQAREYGFTLELLYSYCYSCSDPTKHRKGTTKGLLNTAKYDKGPDNPKPNSDLT